MNAPALVKITDFLNLRPGWCYGEGSVVSLATANQAARLVTALLSYGFDTLDAFPGLNGEIRVTTYVQAHYLEFTLEDEAMISFVYEVADQEQAHQEDLGLDDCVEIIKRMSYLCNSSVSSIKNISTETVVDFKALLSGPLQTVESPLFVVSARWPPPDGSANTLKATTHMSAVTHQFFGNSTLRFCQAHI